MASVHESIAKEHFADHSLEEILSIGLKAFYSEPQLADTPYPQLLRTLNFYRAKSDYETIAKKIKDYFETNEVVDELYFDIKSVMNTKGIYGSWPLLQLIDPLKILWLREALASHLIEVET